MICYLRTDGGEYAMLRTCKVGSAAYVKLRTAPHPFPNMPLLSAWLQARLEQLPEGVKVLRFRYRKDITEITLKTVP